MHLLRSIYRIVVRCPFCDSWLHFCTSYGTVDTINHDTVFCSDRGLHMGQRTDHLLWDNSHVRVFRWRTDDNHTDQLALRRKLKWFHRSCERMQSELGCLATGFYEEYCHCWADRMPTDTRTGLFKCSDLSLDALDAEHKFHGTDVLRVSLCIHTHSYMATYRRLRYKYMRWDAHFHDDRLVVFFLPSSGFLRHGWHSV